MMIDSELKMFQSGQSFAQYGLVSIPVLNLNINSNTANFVHKALKSVHITY
jgi:hypothetical protein